MNIDQSIELEALTNKLHVLRAELAAAQTEARAARDEAQRLADELAGNQGVSPSWLARKVRAQSKALTRLNERVTNQRFTLRALERLGRTLSPEELAQARALESQQADDLVVA